MARSVGLRRLRELSRFVRPLYGFSSLAEVGGYLTEGVGGLIGNDSLVFCEAAQSGGRSTYHGQSMGEALEVYEESIDRFIHQVPFIRYYMGHPGGGAVRTFDIVSQSEWERTELYKEGLRPLGIYEQLGVEIPSAPGTIRGFMLNRERRGFRDRDVEAFDILSGHVAAAAAAADQWGRLDRGAPGSDGRATVMLGARGQVLFRSPEAAALLEAGAGRFRSDLPEIVSRWVEREISRFTSEELWGLPRMPLVLEGAGGVLTLRLLSKENGGVHVLLMERRARGHDRGEGCVRLSPREKEVLRWIAWGKTNPEIAEILGMSIHTVKNHVKRILDVLGVENRTAAVALLMQGEIDGGE